MSIFDIPEGLLDASSKILEARTATGKPTKEEGCGCGEGCDCDDCKAHAGDEVQEAVKMSLTPKNDLLYKAVKDLFPDATNIKDGNYKNHGRVSFETNYNNKGKKVGKHTREYQFDALDFQDNPKNIKKLLSPFKHNLDEDVNSFLNNVLSEKAPPDAKIKNWLEDPKVQASFKDQYGEKYKDVMFGKAWKMYDEKSEEVSEALWKNPQRELPLEKPNELITLKQMLDSERKRVKAEGRDYYPQAIDYVTPKTKVLRDIKTPMGLFKNNDIGPYYEEWYLWIDFKPTVEKVAAIKKLFVKPTVVKHKPMSLIIRVYVYEDSATFNLISNDKDTLYTSKIQINPNDKIINIQNKLIKWVQSEAKKVTFDKLKVIGIDASQIKPRA